MNISLQTIVSLPDLGGALSYNSNIMCLGSCFADAIGSRLAQRWFSCLVNPFGVLFNPASIAQSLARILEHKAFAPSDFVSQDGLYICYDLHGQFSSPSLDLSLTNANNALDQAHNMLLKTDTLILTFGTSFVYQLKETGRVVANCHKTPQSAFIRRRLSVDQIAEAYTLLIDAFLSLRPSLRIILTVSPVRHLRDGIHENTLSKALLHIAADQIIARYPDSCAYFPSYEIAMDELRDYRFYAEDMAHLTSLAEDYIFAKFASCALSRRDHDTMTKAETLMQMLAHRVQNPDSPKARDFYAKIEAKAKELSPLIPSLSPSDLL